MAAENDRDDEEKSLVEGLIKGSNSKRREC